VRKDQLIAVVKNIFGDVIKKYYAPEDGKFAEVVCRKWCAHLFFLYQGSWLARTSTLSTKRVTESSTLALQAMNSEKRKTMGTSEEGGTKIHLKRKFFLATPQD